MHASVLRSVQKAQRKYMLQMNGIGLPLNLLVNYHTSEFFDQIETGTGGHLLICMVLDLALVNLPPTRC